MSAPTSILGPKMSTRPSFANRIQSNDRLLAELEPTIEPAACLEVAAEIGVRLARETIWDSGRCVWLGPRCSDRASHPTGLYPPTSIPGPQALACSSPLCGGWGESRRSAWPQSARSVRRWLEFTVCERQIYSGSIRGLLVSAGRRCAQRSRWRSPRLVDEAAIQLRLCREIKEETRKGSGTCWPAKPARSLACSGSGVTLATTRCWSGRSGLGML